MTFPPGWRISEPYTEEKNKAYRENLTKEMVDSGHPPPKAIPVFASEEEKQAHIFKMQPKSTQEALEKQKKRHSSEDIDYLLRPMPSCVANPDAKTQDELTAMRPLKPDEIQAEEKRRRGSKNTRGASDKGSVDPVKRDKGIHAFTYSAPANLTPEQIKKLTKLEQIISTPLDPEKPRKKKWWKFWEEGRSMSEWTDREYEVYWGKKRD